MSATQIKMERETMYKWKKAYEEEAQDHIATSINLQKLIKELEDKLDVAIEAIQFARMVLSDAKLTGAVNDMNNYLKEIGENK